MTHSATLLSGADVQSGDPRPAARRKRKSRTMTATQEAAFLLVAAVAALLTEALVVLKYAAILE